MIKPISIVIVGGDPEERALTRMQVGSSGKVHVVAESADYTRGLEVVGQAKPDGALIILNGDSDVSLTLVRQLSTEHASTAVMCIGRNCSTETVIKAYRAGAMEFLMQPVSQLEIREAVEKIIAAKPTTEVDDSLRGSVIACYSSRGGCGLTTLSVNLATALAQSVDRLTALVDLNLQQGTAPIFFGVEPAYSIADVVHNLDRLDGQLLKSFHTPVSDKLFCLAAPLKMGDADDVEPWHVEEILSMLRRQFATVIVDCQHWIDATALVALDHADMILLLTLLDMVSVYTTKRTLEMFQQMGYGDDKVRIVVNRYIKNPDLPVDKIERAFGHQIHLLLAENYPAALSALNLGIPLVRSQPKSPLVKQYMELARMIAGQPVTPQKKSKRRFALFGRRHS